MKKFKALLGNTFFTYSVLLSSAFSLNTEAQNIKMNYQPATNVGIIIGNESNKPDGIFGPLTYGFEAGHDFRNGLSLEGAVVRLHEPGTSLKTSVLDEGQLTLLLKEGKIFSQPARVGVMVWKNRMMDMYIKVGGIEVSRDGAVSLNLGLYAGKAERENINGQFIGSKIGAAVAIGKINIALSHMFGAIKTPGDVGLLGMGTYAKSALEISTPLNLFKKFQLELSLGVERRAFNFGNDGPVSDPIDTYIAVTQIKVPVRSIFNVFKNKMR